jgi:hypothetical protein
MSEITLPREKLRAHLESFLRKEADAPAYNLTQLRAAVEQEKRRRARVPNATSEIERGEMALNLYAICENKHVVQWQNGMAEELKKLARMKLDDLR